MMRARRRFRTSALDYLRLLAGTVSAALASLAIFEARSWPMVMLTLGVSEWGHVLVALALTPLLPGWRKTCVGRIGAALGLFGAALALTPTAACGQAGARAAGIDRGRHLATCGHTKRPERQHGRAVG